MGALIALEQAGMKDRVLLAIVDAIEDALRAVRDGRLDATVLQDAGDQGSAAVETAVKILKHEPFAREVFIPIRLATSENIHQDLK
jgi:inositol transport system substrate-binding protein